MDHTGSSKALLTFWFGSGNSDRQVAKQQAGLWWSKNDGIDHDIRTRFEPLLRDTVAGAFINAWPENPSGRLAKIILLDQLPRNMYRGTPTAFATDELAQTLALQAIQLGDESHLRLIERVFLYMPLEHAENSELQELSVERFTALRNLAGLDAQDIFQDFLNFALRHRDIIQRYGRFPHRNAILNRPSTLEEIEFLKLPGSSF